TMRTMFRFAVWDYLSSTSWVLLGLALPILVISNLGAASNAHYNIAWQLYTAVDTVTLSLSTSLLVQAGYDPGRVAEMGRRVVHRQVVIVLPVLAGLAGVAPFVLDVFGAGYSADATGLLRWLCLAALARTVIILWATLLRAEGNARRISVGVVASVAV